MVYTKKTRFLEKKKKVETNETCQEMISSNCNGFYLLKAYKNSAMPHSQERIKTLFKICKLRTVCIKAKKLFQHDNII